MGDEIPSETGSLWPLGEEGSQTSACCCPVCIHCAVSQGSLRVQSTKTSSYLPPKKPGREGRELRAVRHPPSATDLTHVLSSNLHETQQVQHYCPTFKGGNRVSGR